MPERLTEILRAHRLEQLQLRMKLGQGRLPDDALLFSDLEGNPLAPRAVSKRWSAFADKVGVGHVRLHDLRHCHASLLHAAGVPVAVMSKRLGHTKVSTTMNIYVSIFREADQQAAEVLNVSFGGGKK